MGTDLHSQDNPEHMVIMCTVFGDLIILKWLLCQVSVSIKANYSMVQFQFTTFYQ